MIISPEHNQNFVVALISLDVIAFGLSHEITNACKADVINLINTSYPPLDKNLEVKPLILSCNISLTKTKIWLLILQDSLVTLNKITFPLLYGYLGYLSSLADLFLEYDI